MKFKRPMTAHLKCVPVSHACFSVLPVMLRHIALLLKGFRHSGFQQVHYLFSWLNLFGYFMHMAHQQSRKALQRGHFMSPKWSHTVHTHARIYRKSFFEVLSSGSHV